MAREGEGREPPRRAIPPSRQSPPPLFTHRGGVVFSLDRGANNDHKRRPPQRCSQLSSRAPTTGRSLRLLRPALLRYLGWACGGSWGRGRGCLEAESPRPASFRTSSVSKGKWTPLFRPSYPRGEQHVLPRPPPPASWAGGPYSDPPALPTPHWGLDSGERLGSWQNRPQADLSRCPELGLDGGRGHNQPPAVGQGALGVVLTPPGARGLRRPGPLAGGCGCGV